VAQPPIVLNVLPVTIYTILNVLPYAQMEPTTKKPEEYTEIVILAVIHVAPAAQVTVPYLAPRDTYTAINVLKIVLKIIIITMMVANAVELAILPVDNVMDKKTDRVLLVMLAIILKEITVLLNVLRDLMKTMVQILVILVIILLELVLDLLLMNVLLVKLLCIFMIVNVKLYALMECLQTTRLNSVFIVKILV